MALKPKCTECGATLNTDEIDVCEACALALASEADTKDIVTDTNPTVTVNGVNESEEP